MKENPFKCKYCGAEIHCSDDVCGNGYSVDYYAVCQNCGTVVASTSKLEDTIEEINLPVTDTDIEKRISEIDEDIKKLNKYKEIILKYTRKRK